MNEENLIPFTADQNREEAKKNGKKGGKASGEARRRKRDLRLALEMLLEKKMERDGKSMTGTEAITAKLFEQALKGNVKAFETIRSTVGQDPVQKVQVAEVNQDVINEVEKIVEES